jgi:hypothetical protein
MIFPSIVIYIMSHFIDKWKYFVNKIMEIDWLGDNVL